MEGSLQRPNLVLANERRREDSNEERWRKTMSALETVKALDNQISGGDLNEAADMLADDFKFVGVAPAPLGKQEAIGVWTAIRAAAPDFSHNLRDLREAGNMVYGVVEVTGTHTGTLNVPGAPALAATGRPLHNPAERVAITVRNGKAVEWVVEQVPGGGLSGIMGQLS
jgi:ketosteroid isomerase-like protein